MSSLTNLYLFSKFEPSLAKHICRVFRKREKQEIDVAAREPKRQIMGITILRMRR